MNLHSEVCMYVYTLYRPWITDCVNSLTEKICLDSDSDINTSFRAWAANIGCFGVGSSVVEVIMDST